MSFWLTWRFCKDLGLFILKKNHNFSFWKLTFKMAALPSPVATKTTVRAAFRTGRVSVIRSGGGFGESLIGATILSFSCQEKQNRNVKICQNGTEGGVKLKGSLYETKDQYQASAPHRHKSVLKTFSQMWARLHTDRSLWLQWGSTGAPGTSKNHNAGADLRGQCL